VLIAEPDMSEIPSADWSWIHATAERFEQAWTTGPRPLIEHFLAKVDESCWPLLLEELLRVERELRRGAGEETNAEEYHQRFPDHDVVVAAVFPSAPGQSRTAAQDDRLGSTLARRRSRPTLTSSLPEELADHLDNEVVRELDHGGMGVVYVARRNSSLNPACSAGTGFPWRPASVRSFIARFARAMPSTRFC
jgi:hypothetical protein